MAVRSRRLVLTRIVTANVFTSVYTVPTDRTAVVRSILLQNQGAANSTVDVRILKGGTAGTYRIISGLVQVPHQRDNFEEWHVLEEGDQLEVRASATNSTNVWISGALLLGDPS